MNIAVVFGGESCEHDISIITGVQLINNMNKYLYNVIPIYLDKNGNWLTGDSLLDIDNYPNNLNKLNKVSILSNDNYLYMSNKKGNRFKRYIKIDMAFLCLHGCNGEDGTVAGVFELSKIPYFASGICASSVCMDKVIFKFFAKGLGVNLVDGFEVYENDFLACEDMVMQKVENFGFPIIIKPCRQGSSIGISVCESINDFKKALHDAFLFDKCVLIEKFIDVKKEVNIALFDNKGDLVLSNTEEPITSDKFLNFDNKYRKNSGGFETIKRIMPANISDELNLEMVDVASRVYRALKMFGVVRFDFLIDKNDVLYLNEVNTIPGSMSNYLFDKQKYPYSKLIELWISNAVFKKVNNDRFLTVLNTDILNNGFDGLKK